MLALSRESKGVGGSLWGWSQGCPQLQLLSIAPPPGAIPTPTPSLRGTSDALFPRATGRKTEQFQVSVSVAPAAKVTFELVYEELLARHLGVYELLLKVRPQQLVKHLQVHGTTFF